MASLSAAAKSIIRSGSRGGGAAEALEANPFVLPSDDEIFRQREVERKRKEETKLANKGKKIWEKTDYSSTLTRTRKMIEEMTPDVDPVALKKARESKGLVTAATAAIARERHRDRESMTEFLAKKREMFLVQMSLDIKRDEIQKLEDKATSKEKALQRSEQLLEEDAIRFDAFLKENDQQAHDAMKRAELLTKEKLEKAAELKKLRHAVLLVSAERSKLKETLDDFTRYKEFLDKLTPPEWVTEQKRQRAEAAEAKRRERFEQRLAAWHEARAAKEEEVTTQVAADRALALRQGRVPPKVDIPSVVLSLMPPEPRLEDEPPVGGRRGRSTRRGARGSSGSPGPSGALSQQGSVTSVSGSGPRARRGTSHGGHGSVPPSASVSAHPSLEFSGPAAAGGRAVSSSSSGKPGSSASSALLTGGGMGIGSGGGAGSSVVLGERRSDGGSVSRHTSLHDGGSVDDGGDDGEEEEEEDFPMYFTHPQQLLDIFSQLEEDNLFLIQNSQETEQQLEELRQQYAETSEAMARQSALLDESMAALHAQLLAEEGKAAALRRKVGDVPAAAALAATGAALAAAASGPAGSAGKGAAAGAGGIGAAGDSAAGGAGGVGVSGASGAGRAASAGRGGPRDKDRGAASGAASATAAAGGAGAGGAGAGARDASAATMELMLPELRAHIVSVYERCGFKATASSDTISMLTQLEGKLESLIAQLAGMDPEYVALKEKEKEKERRVRVREARMKAQTEVHEQRLQRMLERAQAPVKKRTGKPVMFRSAPFEKKVVVDVPDAALEQEKEDMKYWT